MNERTRRPFVAQLARACIVAAGLAAALLLVHHPMILSGLARVQTELGDTRFIMYAVEHTYLWLVSAPGHAILWNWPVFYPHANVAAYSDLMLGLGPLYWPWRLLGAGPDTSFQLWMLACSAANFLVAYIFLRNIFRVRCLPAAFGALLFACGSCRAAQLGHQNLLCHLYVMTAIYAVFRMFAPASSDGKGGIWFGALCASVVLQLYTAFYCGFFLILALGIALAWSMAFAGCRREVIAFAKSHWVAVVTCLFVGVLAMLPWLKHYLAASRELGPRSYGEVRGMLPRVESWFFMGPTTWWYGWMSNSLYRKLPAPYEHQIGMGLLTPVVVLTGLFWSRHRRSVRITFGTTVTVMFLATYIRWFGLPEPWRAVYAVVPGAGAIRAVARIGMLLLIPASLGLALFLERMLCAGRPFMTAAALAVASACILEQGHTTPSYDKRAVRAEVARLAGKIDPACEAFFYAPSGRDPVWWKPSIDAMWAGLAAGKPAINGNSGNNVPPGWLAIHTALFSGPAPDQRRLARAVAAWLRFYGLNATRICWIGMPPPPPQPPLPLETNLGFQEGEPGADFLGRGFWNPGPKMCWSEGDSAEIVFKRLAPAESDQRYRLALRLEPFAPTKKDPQRFTVFLNGKRLADYSIAAPGESEVAFDFASSDLRAENVLLFRIAAPRSPRGLGHGGDARLLGVGLISMAVHRLPAGPPQELQRLLPADEKEGRAR